MQANYIGQVLLLRRDIPFTQIADSLLSLGYRREESLQQSSLIKGEPEQASWTYQGQKPYVVYTFNPVAKMRVLDVSTLPPSFREMITAKLPVMSLEEMDAYFDSEDARERLLALWAAQELERTELTEKIHGCRNDPEPVVAEQAASVEERLQTIAIAQTNMLTQLRVMAESAVPLIAKLSDSEFASTLKPERQHLSKIFDPNLVDIAERCIEQIYQGKPRTDPIEANNTIDTWAAPAGLLRWPNNLATKFPLGYRELAGWMNPHRIWLTWKVTHPDYGSTQYDGLVWCDDQWLWCPKIFKYLSPYLLAPATRH